MLLRWWTCPWQFARVVIYRHVSIDGRGFAPAWRSALLPPPLTSHVHDDPMKNRSRNEQGSNWQISRKPSTDMAWGSPMLRCESHARATGFLLHFLLISNDRNRWRATYLFWGCSCTRSVEIQLTLKLMGVWFYLGSVRFGTKSNGRCFISKRLPSLRKFGLGSILRKTVT